MNGHSDNGVGFWGPFQQGHLVSSIQYADTHTQAAIPLTLASLNPNSKLSHPSFPRGELVFTTPIVAIVPFSLYCATSSNRPELDSAISLCLIGFILGNSSV